MPLYAYECEKCSKEMEIDSKIGEAPGFVRCPCGDLGRRVIGAPLLKIRNPGTAREGRGRRKG